MNRTSAVLIDRYLANELAGQELDDFEIQLLSNSKLREQVTSAELLAKGLRQEAAHLEATLAPTKTHLVKTTLGNFSGGPLTWVSAATVGVIALASFGMGNWWAASTSPSAFTANQLTLETVRGSQSTSTVGQSAVTLIRMFPSPDLDVTYRAQITDQDQRIIKQVEALRPNVDGSVNLIVTDLEADHYEVTLFTINNRTQGDAAATNPNYRYKFAVVDG